jgi:hypothetical protein
MRLTHRGKRFLCPAFITTDQPDPLAPLGTIAIKMPSGHSENRISRSTNSAVRSVLEIGVFGIDPRFASFLSAFGRAASTSGDKFMGYYCKPVNM